MVDGEPYPTTDFLVPFGAYPDWGSPGSCCHSERHRHHPQILMGSGAGNVWVDMGIAGVIRRLWARGVITGGTCQGDKTQLAYISYLDIPQFTDIVKDEVELQLGDVNPRLDSEVYKRGSLLMTSGQYYNALRWEKTW